jgi:sugar lactone lactonase YvrE
MRNTPLAPALLGAILVASGLAGCADAVDHCEERTPGTICAFMGTGKAGLGKDGVGPLEVQLYMPQDLTFGPDGQPYVLDWNNHRVRTVDADGRVRTVIGTGELGDAPDGVAVETRLNHPTHVTFAPDGALILSAWHNSKVARVDLGAGTIQTICGTGGRAYFGDGGPAHEAVLDLPVATVFDSQGRMIIADQGNQRLRRIDHEGVIDTIFGPDKTWLDASQAWVCPDGAAPGDAACKVCGAADAANPDCAPQARIRPVGYAGDGATAGEARMFTYFSQAAAPAGRIAIDSDDTIYLADTGNHRIRRMSKDGQVDTFAGSGPAGFDKEFAGGFAGDGGPATAALLKQPRDVAIGPDGTVYIADTDNACVRAVDTAGVIRTVAGVCGDRGDGGNGGPATEARLDRPHGVAIGPDGALYIADTQNHQVRVVIPAP